MQLFKRGLFALLVLFFFVSLIKNFFEYQTNVAFYQSYKEEYEKEKKQNETLKTQILKNGDQHEIEKTIRNQLNLLKDGEVAIILPSPTPIPMTPTPTESPVYQQWWKTFVKN